MNDAKGNGAAGFIRRWQGADGKERANAQLFLAELCDLLDLPRPEPAGRDRELNSYVFERRVDIHHPDGSTTRGYIDLYRRECFVLEAKLTREDLDSQRWDKAMLRAQAQADAYIRALPAAEGRPPFLVVLDVGRSIELYSEFTRTGATYVPFPDPRSHRIRLEQLEDEAIRERLRAVWLDPMSLDPLRQTAEVTREIAAKLARLARSLEKDHGPEVVAGFLMRCLFTMFSEDVGLLPAESFTKLLESLEDDPKHFAPMLESLWSHMNSGGFSAELRVDLLRFNGALFAENQALNLDRDKMRLLIEAARADWQYVEPAIFGTLLERALDPEERHKLGAHYTPRAYVERLVLPTIIDPLRDEWKNVQGAAAALDAQGKHDKAVKEIRAFHRHLCETRILDPACGSGNFLYVTLEHMKRLEGEIMNTLQDMGESQNLLEMQGNTVDPHQFLGLEINPRAAAITEMVLWIGYLQWHFRTLGHVNPPQPVLRAFENIDCRDAVLAYDEVQYLLDDTGKPVTRWDGKTWKKSPTTGEDIPDESAQVPVEAYVNPRKAEWPEADYVVGNPPFIGNKRMRIALGDGYVDALRDAWKGDVSRSSDFVMYWWHQAASLLQKGALQQFGLITTNSIKQSFNRKVVDSFLNAKKKLSLRFAVPDHPWVDSAEGAAVRIAMTVAGSGDFEGTRGIVVNESPNEESEVSDFSIEWNKGKLFADLSIGANVSGCAALLSNTKLCSRGIIVHGSGFVLSADQRKTFEEHAPAEQTILSEFVSGRDINQKDRHLSVINTFGLTLEDLRTHYPYSYQWLFERVRPERQQKKAKGLAENWWLHWRPRTELQAAIKDINSYLATTYVSKHRFFVVLEKSVLPDDGLVGIALDQPYQYGILSSRLHVLWSLRAGGRLGVGNDPMYNSKCFGSFPFLAPSTADKARIGNLFEQLDAHRKRQKEKHPSLTMTSMYNALEKLRRDEPLTDKERGIHQQGLVSVLRELHDDLDRTVFAAYGWEDLGDKLVGRPGATTPWPEKPDDQAEAEEGLLQRLVDLNHQRAAEEATGIVRWLRPEYQAPDQAPDQTEIETGEEIPTPAEVAAPETKLPWPKTLQDQVRAVREELVTGPMTPETLAARFKRKPEKSVIQVLEALTELGMLSCDDTGQFRLGQ